MGDEKITYQHRDTVVIPGSNAGESALRVVLPHASERVLEMATLSITWRSMLNDSATMYRNEYAATGLLGCADGSPGRTRSTTGSRIENMGDREMVAFRAHNSARGSMKYEQAIEVDRVVLDERDDAVRMREFIAGMTALAVYYRNIKWKTY